MASDSVVLEATFVQLPPSGAEDESLWTHVDEQHLPMDTRRRLQDNGLRTGLVGSQFPDELRRLLDRPGVNELFAAGRSPEETELFSQQKRLQMRAGQSHPILVTPGKREEMVVLLREEGTVRAQRFADPRGYFTIQSSPLGDGRVRLDLTPEIEHGELRQRIVGGQGSLLLKNSRERHIFEELRISTVLSPGQTLLLTCTPAPKGLGEQLFVSGKSNAQARTLMLVRLAQTQIDDLFLDDDLLPSGG
ncbi:MAG: hypothetical protein ACC628_16220 [Pirellulaceae bacterium]